MAQTEELSAARMRTPRIYPSVTHAPWPACAGSVQSVLSSNDITSPHLNITVEYFCRYVLGVALSAAFYLDNFQFGSITYAMQSTKRENTDWVRGPHC